MSGTSVRSGRLACVLVSASVAVLLMAMGSGSIAASAASPAWVLQSIPDAAGSTYNSLDAVSCPSAKACVAVGDQENGGASLALGESWNGIKWVVVPTVTPKGSSNVTLTGVSCTSASACTAVGSYTSAGDTGVALVERWNGTAWAAQTFPVPSGTTDSGLAAVSCTSSTACTAVGTYSTPSAANNFAERWNGTKWAVQPAPDLPGATSNALSAVSCTSSKVCIAVGTDSSVAVSSEVAETWNGTSWTVQAIPSSALLNLDAISCTASTSCVAVGNTTAGNQSGLSEVWNGTSWRSVAVPGPTDTTDTTVAGVSCTSAKVCVAVGSADEPPGVYPSSTTAAEAWNGTKWTLQTTENPPGLTLSSLNAVSCSSASACTAVGGYVLSDGGGVGSPIAERHT